MKIYLLSGGVVVTVALISVLYFRQGSDEPIDIPQDSIMVRDNAVETGNTLQGTVKVIYGKARIALPKGALMVYQDKNLPPVTFGRIDIDGNYTIPKVPEGTVYLALWQDENTPPATISSQPPEAVLKSMKRNSGASSVPFLQQHGAMQHKLEGPEFVGMPIESLAVIKAAYDKYGHANTTHSIKCKVAPGDNAYDIQLVLP